MSSTRNTHTSLQEDVQTAIAECLRVNQPDRCNMKEDNHSQCTRRVEFVNQPDRFNMKEETCRKCEELHGGHISES
jgi:hypothetical protein